jgi:hypothetical protein
VLLSEVLLPEVLQEAITFGALIKRMFIAPFALIQMCVILVCRLLFFGHISSPTASNSIGYSIVPGCGTPANTISPHSGQ